MEHFLKLSDISKEEIVKLLDLASDLKDKQKKGIAHQYLKGKSLGMIFRKNSTRTRVSFEVGMYQLGGQALYLPANTMQLEREECIEDTAKVLSRYLDGIMIRTYEQSEIEDLALNGSIPIINGLSDLEHPCQVMADLLTIKEHFKSFDNLRLCYVGDGNNMANSLILGCIKLGIGVNIACPKNYEPDKNIMEWAKNNGDFKLYHDVNEACQDVNIFYTDVFISMGQEEETIQRKLDFKGFQIDKKLVEKAADNAIVLHCLPAHRDEEISSEVLEMNEKYIFEQAENRLHAQKAILVELLKNK